MRTTMSLTAAVAVIIFAFSGAALARGGYGGGGRGAGACGNCPKQPAVSAVKSACDGTGRMTAAGTRPQDGTGARYGRMGASATTAQPAPADSAAPPAN